MLNPIINAFISSQNYKLAVTEYGVFIEIMCTKFHRCLLLPYFVTVECLRLLIFCASHVMKLFEENYSYSVIANKSVAAQILPRTKQQWCRVGLRKTLDFSCTTN